jgi:hypothetical protein
MPAATAADWSIGDLWLRGDDPAMFLLATVAPATMSGRIAVVLLGVAILILTLVGARRLYPPSFFRGFVVAVGIFLSFDIVVFHWLFRLHRITAGPEADVIEPILVAAGVGFVVVGLRGESRSSVAPPARPPSEGSEAGGEEGRR